LTRNLSIDAYRGFVMLLMMGEVLRLSKVAAAYPDNALLAFLAYHQTHVEWVGCSLHDLIQPSFSFLVGTALAYSIRKRTASGEDFGAILRHSLWRSFLLVALGIFLRSASKPITYFTFEDTLTQIGLGYTFLVLSTKLSDRALLLTTIAIFFAYWLAWALYPLPGQPFAAHWQKGENLGTAFDRFFLNLFPRTEPFVEHRGGYGTLSFIHTLGTMMLGLLAGRFLIAKQSIRDMARWGILILAAGLLVHFLGLCPIVKRIWTPSWTLASGGACFLLLAAFRLWLENKSEPGLAFPLIVVGANSIAAYLIAHWWDGFFASSWRIHFGWLPGADGLTGIVVLTLEWLCLYWMYRNRVFLKI